MSIHYLPMKTPSVSSRVMKQMVDLDKIPEKDIPIMGEYQDPEEKEASILNHEEKEVIAVDEGATNYAPDKREVTYAPISTKADDKTKMSQEDDEGILGAEKEVDERNSLLSDKHDYEEMVPSAIDSYYNESALKAKTRNGLPDEAFGLPRLRKYPLHDEKHVRQAIRMFGHCKDPKDRATLAKNIFAAMEKFDMKVDIGKDNDLYEYLPKSLQESAESGSMSAVLVNDALGIKKKRTKEDVVADHIAYNTQFFNNVFYNPEYARFANSDADLSILDAFHPDMITQNLYTRLKTSCGGLGLDATIYDKVLKIRKPLETDFTKPLGDCNPDKLESFEIMVPVGNDPLKNWYRVDLTDDLDHVLYCLRLYSIAGEIFNNPNFDSSNLTDIQRGILYDWKGHVNIHYDLMKDAEEDGDRKEYYKQLQYLHDLMWNFLDNPYSDDDTGRLCIGCLRSMACISSDGIKIKDGSFITKADCAEYLLKELGLDDDIFLLPGYMEYPIISQGSVRLAMDLIQQVEKEYNADDVYIFIKNLNRKYKELGCTFSLSPDHPYTKYADKSIIDNLAYVLVEGETCVDDAGTSIGSVPLTHEPWYKRLDVTGTLERGGALENHEMGPNENKKAQPDDISKYNIE